VLPTHIYFLTSGFAPTGCFGLGCVAEPPSKSQHLRSALLIRTLQNMFYADMRALGVSTEALLRLVIECDRRIINATEMPDP
jgi:hypothetical protein